MAAAPTLKSDFAILDVKAGRNGLAKHFERPFAKPIPVTITGFIDGIHSADDGISREFSVAVTGVAVEAERS